MAQTEAADEQQQSSIPADLPDVEVPEMRDDFNHGAYWVVDSEKANVPEDNLRMWQSRLEEIEEAALMLAKAAQNLQSVNSPADGYEKFMQLKKAWNKTSYQTRCVTEGVSIKEENYVVAESE